METPDSEIKPQQPQQPEPKKPFISSKMRAEKRRNLFKKIICIVTFILMVGWAFIYFIPSSDEQQNENLISVGGYNFYIQPDGVFYTYINIGNSKIPVGFRLDPRNASSISIDSTAVQQVLTAKKLYIAFNPNTEETAKMAVAVAEISRILGLYNIETVGAYLHDSNPPNPNVPIRTCDDVSSTVTVLELGVDAVADTGIQNDKGCIKITGKTADDLISAADKLGMNLIGIKL